MKKTKKNAFSVLELSFIIVIIAIIGTTTIAAQTIVSNTKMTSIIVESEIYKRAIVNFYNKYQCIPGDCNQDLLMDRFSEFPAVLDQCNPSNDASLSMFSNLKINVPAKRTCAFWELSMTGFLPVKLNFANPDRISISQSITGLTMPHVNKNKDLSWQLITAGTDDAGNRSLPIEATATVNKEYIGRLTLVITKSNYDIRHNLAESYWPALLVNIPKSIAGVDVKDAHYVDKKIDTGSPYVGAMISGRDIIDLPGNNDVESGCTTVFGDFTEDKINHDAKYNLNKKNQKCIMAFILPKFN